MCKYYLKVTHVPTNEVIAISQPSGEEGLFSLEDICYNFGKNKLQYLEVATDGGNVTIPEGILKDCTIMIREVPDE